MSCRFAIGVGALTFFVFGASQLQAQTGAPSAADIGQQLRPAPKLGPSQGIPHIGVSRPEADPSFHPASTSPERGGPAPPVGKRPSSGTAFQRPATAETHSPSMDFRTIQFAFASTQLTPESSATLRNLGDALNHQLSDQKSFLIEGHTDRKGTRAYNDELSKGRAEAVKDYLVRETGVSPDRLQTVGKGFSEPANPKNPYAAENRRVAVVNTGS
jgi:outer membrane protein OmpA-like peptidoglycan-associated protein